MSVDLLQQIDRAIGNDEFEVAIQLCAAASKAVNGKTPYWYWGLIALLQNQAAQAQAIWRLNLSEGSADERRQWTIDLAEILRRETQRRSNLPIERSLRQNLRDLVSSDLNNLLHLLQLTKDAAEQSELAQAAIELLQTGMPVDLDLLQTTLRYLMVTQADAAPDLAEASLSVAPPNWIDTMLLPQAIEQAASGNFELADRYADLSLRLDPQHVPTLAHLTRLYLSQERFRESVELAQRYSQLAPNFDHQLAANTLLLKGLLSLGSAWTSAVTAQHQQINLLKAYLAAADRSPNSAVLCSPLYYAPYLADNPQETRSQQNQAAAAYQATVEPQAPIAIRSAEKLRIGYLSRCLRQHSVGWLSRWLFQHHDRESFEIYTYFLQSTPLEAFSEQWFANASTQFRLLSGDPRSIAAQIRQDAIDLLVDLDSITVPLTCEVMALKPAPIQATWLGTDASGLPAIDYFIADPYVLPDDAQADYAERIWRLPNSYIAVDGFEVGVPTLRRDQLGLPDEAIVYYSSQSAYKRHPDTIRAQMQILRRVPNSYLLLKGLGDTAGLQQCFGEIAAAENVRLDRLRFLPIAPDEQTHRANLAIADVVLDTFPYNGATTTLETLWMGIPLVTQVGSQFAARNSYTMLKNVGIAAGIAWSRQEYVEWGVKFGQDPILRQQTSWQLRQARHTAPLWNARQFTRELEQAYLQMCHIR